MDQDKAFSTGEVAKYCSATTASVNNWIKNNKIKAYSTPGGQYRILLPDLIKFLQENNMPIPTDLKKHLAKKVLIIEDDHKIAEIVKTIVNLIDDACSVEIANDGYSGLLKAGEIKPNLIFLDLQLPEMDGFTVCDKIKSSSYGSEIKVIVLSAFLGHEKFKDRLKSCKANAFIEKPFEVEKLKEKIKSFL